MKTSTIINKTRTKLMNGSYTCVIAKNDEIIFTSYKRGVEPLMDFNLTDKKSDNLVLADKVIGKAAALLCIKIGFKYIFTDILSTHAKEIFTSHSIIFEYNTEVSAIQNRNKTGLCPMESLSEGVSDPEVMYDRILEWQRSK